MVEKLYSKEDFKKYAVQQMICNKDKIRALEISAEVIKKFDGKILTIRLKKAIDEELEKVMRETHFFIDKQYTMTTYAKLYCRENDSYTTKTYNDGTRSVNYVDYEIDFIICFQDGNKIDSTKTVEQINGKIKTLQQENKDLQHEHDYINSIEAEFNDIMKRRSEFREKYSYTLQKLYNINY